MSEHNTAAPQAATFTAIDKANSATATIVLHEDVVESGSPSIPPLFKPTKVRVKEYWEIISLVAPYVDESKEWKTSDALKAYCTKCNIPIPWTFQSPKQVQRHMAKYHGNYLATKRKTTAAEADKQKTLNYYFSKKLRKDLAPAMKSDQTKSEVLLVKWIAISLRPFLIVEDNGFLNFVDFLCSLHQQFSGELVESKMKDKIKNNIKYFSAMTDIWPSRTMESFMAITLHTLTDDFSMITLTLDVMPLQGKHAGTFIMEQYNDGKF
jgi:hypothetical protein